MSPIKKTYDDAEGRTHDEILDGETGEVLSDRIRIEPDPDEIRDREMEEKK
jgi:hypothetical protein